MLFVVVPAFADSFPPRAAKKYLKQTVREARYRNLPPENVAGQIHQESGWDSAAKSPYAEGLSQFTPDTVSFVKTVWPREFGEGDALSPGWAVRAMCRYDRWLLDRVNQSYVEALRAYNGGLGWIQKECSGGLVCAPSLETCRRFRSAASCAENLDYPRRILEVWAPRYKEFLNPFNAGAGQDARAPRGDS
ncbi:MAG: lytic transglycosylase domain-containing protein [Proteobacteria bacterium]|nr:lytic transglycosylase domain-containing protein [Pseudomonadota bacterium]